MLGRLVRQRATGGDDEHQIFAIFEVFMVAQLLDLVDVGRMGEVLQWIAPVEPSSIGARWQTSEPLVARLLITSVMGIRSPPLSSSEYFTLAQHTSSDDLASVPGDSHRYRHARIPRDLHLSDAVSNVPRRHLSESRTVRVDQTHNFRIRATREVCWGTATAFDDDRKTVG